MPAFRVTGIVIRPVGSVLNVCSPTKATGSQVSGFEASGLAASSDGDLAPGFVVVAARRPLATTVLSGCLRA
jgi:hypothetical protein